MWGAAPFPFFFLMPIFGLLWLGLLVLGAYFIIRAVRNTGGHASSARRILEERFARGEISSEEFRERLQTLS